MNYGLVLSHIQRILRECGDGVVFIPAVNEPVPSQYRSGDISIAIGQTLVKEENDCFKIYPPIPMAKENPSGKYKVNRIRISANIVSDYQKNAPYTDEQIKSYIANKKDLFGYYELNVDYEV